VFNIEHAVNILD